MGGLLGEARLHGKLCQRDREHLSDIEPSILAEHKPRHIYFVKEHDNAKGTRCWMSRAYWETRHTAHTEKIVDTGKVRNIADPAACDNCGKDPAWTPIINYFFFLLPTPKTNIAKLLSPLN